MRQPDAMVMRRQGPPPSSTLHLLVARRCRGIIYGAAVSPLLLLIILASVYPDVNRTEVPDWRPLVSRADEALNNGDRYEARRLYLHADRVAYWRKDWEGLIVAACCINKLDGVTRPHSRTLAILFRAAAMAEQAQSRQGITAVAKSLALLGSDEAAATVLARIQPGWPNEAANFDSRNLLGGCAR